jgi:hypothetical protein
MKKTFLTFGLAIVTAAPLAAQNINNSDFSSPGITTSTVGGMFSPGNVGGVNTASSGMIVIGATASASISSGSARSGVTGAVIPAAAGAAVAALLSGAAGSVATVQGQMNAAGAPTAETAALMSALAGLGANPSPAAVRGAVEKFNAMIAASSPAFLNNAPPVMLAIHNALVTFSEALMGK